MFSFLDYYSELPTNVTPLNRSKLDVDCDSDAELLMVINRESLVVLKKTELSTSSVVSVLLPASYATGGKLMVLIIDKDGEYNAAVIDGVSAELLNLR